MNAVLLNNSLDLNASVTVGLKMPFQKIDMSRKPGTPGPKPKPMQLRGKRGRPPKSVEEHKRDGTYQPSRHKKLEELEPATRELALMVDACHDAETVDLFRARMTFPYDPPEDFREGTLELRTWNEIKSWYENGHVVNVTDYHAVVAYCRIWAILEFTKGVTKGTNWTTYLTLSDKLALNPMARESYIGKMLNNGINLSKVAANAGSTGEDKDKKEEDGKPTGFRNLDE